MSKTQSKVGLIVTAAILLVVVAVVSALAFLRNTPSSEVATNTTGQTSQTSSDTTGKDDKTETDDTPEKPAPSVDPATLVSVDVESLGIVVYYSKGTPGFDFAIKRTTSRTQYVEFTSASLAGTKCTDDQGLFASIIKNPTSNEDQTTISDTVKVGEDTYGLSLASAGCTNNTELLTQYQTGFKEGFSSLKAL